MPSMTASGSSETSLNFSLSVSVFRLVVKLMARFCARLFRLLAGARVGDCGGLNFPSGDDLSCDLESPAKMYQRSL